MDLVKVDFNVISDSALSTLRKEPEKATTEEVTQLVNLIDFFRTFTGSGRYWELMCVLHDMSEDKFGPKHIDTVLSQRRCQNCVHHNREDDLSGRTLVRGEDSSHTSSTPGFWSYGCFKLDSPLYRRPTHFDFRCVHWQLDKEKM